MTNAGITFEDALTEAKEKGYAEADPSQTLMDGMLVIRLSFLDGFHMVTGFDPKRFQSKELKRYLWKMFPLLRILVMK